MTNPNQQLTRRDMEARLVAKAWKDEAYKQKLLTNPQAAIEEEFAVQLPEGINIQVVEENPTSLYFVLPMPPELPGQEISDEQLEAIAGGSHSPDVIIDSVKMTISIIASAVTFEATNKTN